MPHRARTHPRLVDSWQVWFRHSHACALTLGRGSDDHHVDDLLIEAGSAYRAEPVGVELTLNGLQFSDGDPNPDSYPRPTPNPHPHPKPTLTLTLP